MPISPIRLMLKQGQNMSVADKNKDNPFIRNPTKTTATFSELQKQGNTVQQQAQPQQAVSRNTTKPPTAPKPKAMNPNPSPKPTGVPVVGNSSKIGGSSVSQINSAAGKKQYGLSGRSAPNIGPSDKSGYVKRSMRQATQTAINNARNKKGADSWQK